MSRPRPSWDKSRLIKICLVILTIPRLVHNLLTLETYLKTSSQSRPSRDKSRPPPPILWLRQQALTNASPRLSTKKKKWLTSSASTVTAPSRSARKVQGHCPAFHSCLQERSSLSEEDQTSVKAITTETCLPTRSAARPSSDSAQSSPFRWEGRHRFWFRKIGSCWRKTISCL